MKALKEALTLIDNIEQMMKSGHPVNQQDIAMVRSVLENAGSAEKSALDYTDPESPSPETDNTLHTVSGLRAGEAYNDLCRMLGGQYPDCRIQEEAPKAHAFFMALFGVNKTTEKD